MKFSDIYGQEETKEYFRKLKRTDRIPHAILLSGKQGSGKLALALALASYIQCENNIDGDSCGECPACRKSFQFIHPDIHYMIPTVSLPEFKVGGTPSSYFYPQWRNILSDHPYFELNDWMKELDYETKKPNLPKNAVMEVNKVFNLKIFEGKKRICIVWQSELLQKEGNRLLKLIEEPPENSIFILIAENLDRVLSTIASRCQIINVPPFTDVDLKAFGQERYSFESDKLEQLSQVANGNIIEFIKLAENTNADLYMQFFNWLRLAYRARASELVKWSEDFTRKSKDDQKYFYINGLSFFEQFLLSFSVGLDHIRLQEEAFEILKNMKAVLDEEKTIQIIELLNSCVLNHERNANVKLHMINSSLTLHKIMTGK